MNEMHDQITRLEARIDHQAVRIDALYAAIEREGIFPRPVTGSRPGEPPEAGWEVAAVPPRKQRRKLPSRRRAPGFHLGNATGV
jgi:hypothetical protein